MMYLLGAIIVLQMGMIYGLVNRLMRQSGHAGMSATELLKKAEKMILDGNKDDPKKPQGRFSREKLVGSAPLELAVPENYGKVSLNPKDYVKK